MFPDCLFKGNLTWPWFLRLPVAPKYLEKHDGRSSASSWHFRYLPRRLWTCECGQLWILGERYIARGDMGYTYIGIWEDLFKKWFCNSLYTSSTYYIFLLFEHVKHKTYRKLMNCCCFNSFWFYLLHTKLYLRNTYTNFFLDISTQSTTHDYPGDGQCDGRNSSSDSFYYECQHQHYLGQDDCRLKIIIAQLRRMGLEYLPTFGLDLW